MNGTVLVVDDEERIRSSLRGILCDEGFRVLETGHAPRALDIVGRERPELVLLDVWMPEIDGIELLRQIKALKPETHVIMISGHANIQNAVAATKLGAEDFLEKPFSVNGLLASIGRVLGGETGGARSISNSVKLNGAGESLASPSIAMAAIAQRTISRSIVIAGQGLHSGLKSGVILHPAPINSGIVFSSLAGRTPVAALLENVADTGYNTTLAGEGHAIRTVEHLMSALHGFGISNLLVKTDDEIPALDGSALEFCRQISQAGVENQDAAIEPIRIAKAIAIDNEDGSEFIRIDPARRMIVDYTLEYPAPIGQQRAHFELTSPQAYMREIAPARTFGFVREFRKLAEMGLARGGRLDNVILVDDEKVVNTTLRSSDEFARHKILDLIGDLYLLGRPIIGHIRARRTGHSDNLALLRAIRDSLA
ncbi:MAG: UDP-3-O-acyl-N-acetylglucosamine deacetylase [Candidatus Binataceae bacterium]